MVISTYAQQMSVDEATVKSYIAQMDDETLFGYVEQSIREQVTEQYAAGVQARLSNMTSDQLAMALDLALEKSPAVTPLTAEQYNWLYDNYMPATVSNGTYEDNLKLLGDVDLASPKTINIYASTFADKDAIADAIKQYNSSVSEDDQIDYTDYVALLMSSVTTIINAISYVLIAFVAISLVVSSIMIGIITYISVLERTKEIGILRAIGASKRDISRVFNAETLIEGFCSGAIGIGITLLLIIPINLVVHHLTGIESLNAILPVAALRSWSSAWRSRLSRASSPPASPRARTLSKRCAPNNTIFDLQKGRFPTENVLFLFYRDFTKGDFLILQPAFMMANVARNNILEKLKGSISNEKVSHSCADRCHGAEPADRLRQQERQQRRHQH